MVPTESPACEACDRSSKSTRTSRRKHLPGSLHNAREWCTPRPCSDQGGRTRQEPFSFGRAVARSTMAAPRVREQGPRWRSRLSGSPDTDTARCVHPCTSCTTRRVPEVAATSRRGRRCYASPDRRSRAPCWHQKGGVLAWSGCSDYRDITFNELVSLQHYIRDRAEAALALVEGGGS